MSDPTPVQPAANPLLCRSYDEPTEHWFHDKENPPKPIPGGRPASYFFKTERTGSTQRELFAEENREDLRLVNLLRDDVRRWREAGYRGALNITRELLTHWTRAEKPRRLFFCQREAVETIIYLAELRLPGRSARTGFHKFELADDDLARLLRGERPSFVPAERLVHPTLIDPPAESGLLPRRRLGCKMATGSGKTVVMGMLIAWAFCNRAHNPSSTLYPSADLACCPNLTVNERLQALRPEHPDNYYTAFDLVPLKYRSLLRTGRVLVTNWHAFAPQSEQIENGKSYAVVDKGPETPEVSARRVLGWVADRLPLLVLNDEGHHCWRPRPTDEELTGDERSELECEVEEATVWVDGLDKINNALASRERERPEGAEPLPQPPPRGGEGENVLPPLPASGRGRGRVSSARHRVLRRSVGDAVLPQGQRPARR
jgi:type III restriction enzyme